MYVFVRFHGFNPFTPGVCAYVVRFHGFNPSTTGTCGRMSSVFTDLTLCHPVRGAYVVRFHGFNPVRPVREGVFRRFDGFNPMSSGAWVRFSSFRLI